MKRIVYLIMCLIFTLGATASGVVFAAEEGVSGAYLYSYAEIGENGEIVLSEQVLNEGKASDVIDYMNFSKDGNVIVLSDDVKLTKNTTLQSVNGTVAYFVIKGSVRFDLNGYTLTHQAGTEQSTNPIFVVPKGSFLEIVDTSETKKGVVNGVCGAVLVTGGNLNFMSGTLMAQATASSYPDDGELTVQITNNGFFNMSGGKILYDGKLEDGRIYESKSGAIFVDETAMAYMSGGEILGTAEILGKENVHVTGGRFSFDISDYISPVFRCEEHDGIYTVGESLPVAAGIFNADEIDIKVGAVYSEDKENVMNYTLTADTQNERGKIVIDMEDVIRTSRHFEREQFPSLKICTSMGNVSLEKTVFERIVRLAGNKKIYFEMESIEKPVDEVINKLENAKLKVMCAFKTEDGEILKTDDVYVLEIPYNASNSVQVHTQTKASLLEKRFENEDGIISCFVSNGESVVVAEGVAIAILGRTLDLQGTISMVFYANLSGVEPSSARMLFWDSPQEEYTEQTAHRIVPYSSKTANGYRFEYKNIASTEMNKMIYARLVAKDNNGDIVYGKIPQEGYSVSVYANNMMKNQKLRPLLIKMLNYGAAAQEYFGSDDMPANHILSEPERVMDLTKVYRSEAETIVEETTNGNCEAKIAGKTLMLEGDISINYYVTSNEPVDEMGILFWSKEAYESTDSHILGTQTRRLTKYVVNGNYKVFTYGNIVSSEMFEPIYARLYTKTGNVYKYSDIDLYSVKDYAANQIKSNTDPQLIKLLRSMLLYGDEAEKYFRLNN